MVSIAFAALFLLVATAFVFTSFSQQGDAVFTDHGTWWLTTYPYVGEITHTNTPPPPDIQIYGNARHNFFNYAIYKMHLHMSNAEFETLEEEAAALLLLKKTYYEPLLIEWDAYRRANFAGVVSMHPAKIVYGAWHQEFELIENWVEDCLETFARITLERAAQAPPQEVAPIIRAQMSSVQSGIKIINIFVPNQ
jgi:hypothetical protein